MANSSSFLVSFYVIIAAVYYHRPGEWLRQMLQNDSINDIDVAEVVGSHRS